ncbi:MAG: alpha-amylase family glycosyl hydrolase, partial [Wenzhouxiangellaceae bacterium]
SNDTGGIEGGRLQHGFDPTHKGFYHGGDLKGLTGKLDYIQGLGATAIWLTPVFVNKPVQGPAGDESAGYHGYWILDFTDIDPHLGTREDYRAFVEAAHARGMKVIMDIVVNHTADVNQYRECADYNPEADIWWSECEYRSIEDYPWTTRGGPDGETINEGFAGDSAEHRTTENFARLKTPDWAYEVFIPERERNARTPAWLNDPLVYHNRGNSHWEGESSLYGDFSGLDDVFTEDPLVLKGMLEIYTDWIREFGIDGFRVDTAKHVNDGFWREFNPVILETARERGIDDFFLFGESYETSPEALARHTREAAWPAVLDFAFAHTAQDVITGKAGPSALAKVFASDHLYEGDERGANILPTFIGNHDDGRIGHFLLEALGADADDEELLARSILGHALLMFSRGVPVIYYGDEQGFTGDGRDQDAREDMFPSQVEIYNDNRLIGTQATTAEDNFNPEHPIYRAIAEMARVYHDHPVLRRGRQETLSADPEPGLLALKKSLGDQTALLLFNFSTEPLTRSLNIDGNWHAAIQRGL